MLKNLITAGVAITGTGAFALYTYSPAAGATGQVVKVGAGIQSVAASTTPPQIYFQITNASSVPQGFYLKEGAQFADWDFANGPLLLPPQWHLILSVSNVTAGAGTTFGFPYLHVYEE